MIELNEYTVSRGDLFRITFWQTLKTCSWLFAYSAVVLIGMTFDDWIVCLIGTLTLAVALPLSVYASVWYYLPSPKDIVHYQKRKLSFDAGKFHTQTEDGSESHILLSHIIRAYRLGDYYCLFFNKTYWYPIPTSAFRSEEDRIRFETEILGDKLKAGVFSWKYLIAFPLISACLFGLAYAFQFVITAIL